MFYNVRMRLPKLKRQMFDMFALAFCLTLVLTCAVQATIQVELSGLEGELLQNAKSWMVIERQKEVPYLNTRQVQRLHRAAFRQIRRALRPFGYYQVQVTGELVKLDANEWRASYQVVLGKQSKLTKAHIQMEGDGAEHPALIRAARQFPLQVGDVVIHEKYETGKANLIAKAKELGYLEAHYSHSSIYVNSAQNKAELHMVLNTGPRFYIGSVNFSSTFLDDEFLNKFIPFDSGDPYSDQALSALQSELLDSGFFSEVEIRPEFEQSADNIVPILINLISNPRTRYTLGVGYGTDTGARASARAQIKPINRWGHKVSARVQPSEWIREWSIAYDIPLDDPLRRQLEFRWGWNHSNRDDNESKRKVLSVNQVGRRNRWRETRFINIESEEYLIGNKPEASARGFIPGVSWSRVRTNHPIWIERGRFNELTFRQSIPIFGFDTKATQLEFRNRWVSQAEHRGRWITKLDLGATFIDELADLPLSQRFYAGGDESVRGYGTKALTPRDADGDRVGGKYLLIIGLEREYHWKGKWHYAWFIDSGNAMDEWDHSLAHGVGLGIRRQSPIGPIRIDIANGLNEDDLGGWRIHLSLGPEL